MKGKEMDRRQLLKLAPLAALGAAPFTPGNATAYELRKDKRYILVFKPGSVTNKDLDWLSASFKELGIRGIAMHAEDSDLTIYELESAKAP